MTELPATPFTFPLTLMFHLYSQLKMASSKEKKNKNKSPILIYPLVFTTFITLSNAIFDLK